MVDDTPKSVGVLASRRIDEQWDLQWRQLIQGIGIPAFGVGDMIDATDDPEFLTFALLNQYRGVIWHIGLGESFFRNELAPISGKSNWLTIYQESVGNLMFVGSGAMSSTLGRREDEFPIVFTGANSTRYPAINWCLSALDQVRPLAIFGEVPGQRLRETKCSEIVYAGPAPEFFAPFETSSSRIAALHPTDMRRYGVFRYNSGPDGKDPTELNTTRLEREEFYNVNVTSMPVTVTPRDCQTPMYRAIARRDVDEPSIFASPLAEGWTDIGLGLEPAIVDSVFLPKINPDEFIDDCASQTGRARLPVSPISLKTIAIASDVFSGRGANPPTKQEGTLIAADFLWGFNPIHFRAPGLRSTLRWIIVDHWGVNDDF